MTDTGQKILKKIKEDRIRPYPKWRFLFKRSVIWTVFLLSILLGSIASASAMFQLRYAEWDLYQHLSHSLIELVLLVVPIFWLIFLGGFTWFAYYYFRQTEQGYRYGAIRVISGSIMLSTLGGGLLYISGLPEKLEPIFLDKVPYYREWQAHKQRIWMSPAQGLLAGRIASVVSDRKIQLEDLEGKLWEIEIADTVWRGRLEPVRDLKIKIIGHCPQNGRFVAEEIRPWQGQGQKKGAFRGKGLHGKGRLRSKSNRGNL